MTLSPSSSLTFRRMACWITGALTLIVLLGLGQSLPAQSVAPAGDGPRPVIENVDTATKKPIGPPSVVVEFKDAGETFKKQLEAIEKAYHEQIVPIDKVRRLQTEQKKFIDNPDDDNAAADYADAFSDALAAFAERLRKFIDSHSALEKSFSSFVASTEAGIEAEKKDLDRNAKLESETQLSVQTMEQTLDELTKEFQPQIDQGLALPPEVDLQVVRLGNLIQRKQVEARLHNDRVKRATRGLKELESSLAGGKLKKVRMNLKRERAEGDLGLTAAIAEGEAQKLAPAPVQFDTESDDSSSFAVPDIGLFLTTSNESKPSAEQKTPDTKVTSLGGAELLKARRSRKIDESPRDSNPTAKK